jgi:hypothetical protein
MKDIFAMVVCAVVMAVIVPFVFALAALHAMWMISQEGRNGKTAWS